MGVNSSKGFDFRLIANGIQLDLFQDETITLSNNVTGLFDIGVLPSDFTRQITIPGTKGNNSFFQHIYDISVESPYLFSTNVKVPAYFDFDGVYLSQGYIQLAKVNVYANKFIESYEITMYGSLSSFSRDLNKYFLTDLSNLSVYNHTSTYDNIVDSWDGNLFDGDIVYPFCDYGTGWTVTAGAEFFGIDDVEGGITVQDYKPAIRVKKVLDAIFEFTGYTYSSSFFDQPMFDDMYMICNNTLKYPEYEGVDMENYGQIKLGPISGSGMTDWILPYNTIESFPWYNKLSDPNNIISDVSSYNVQKSSALKGIISLNLNVSSSVNQQPKFELCYWPTGSAPDGAGSGNVALTNFDNYFTQYYNANTGGGGINIKETITTQFVTPKLAIGNFFFGLKYYSNYSPLGGLAVTVDPGGSTKSYFQITKAQQSADGRTMDIPLNMPYGERGIKLIDFIKGLQKKYSLVMYPNNLKQNEFIIETFNNWYNRGQLLDFNKYINLDEKLEVIPANNLAVNKLEFGDKLGNDYIALQFSKKNTREFGKTYYTDTQNFFSQGEFKIETTFSVTPLSYVVGTGLSGSAQDINPGPGFSFQFYFGGSSYTTAEQACSNTSSYPLSLWATTPYFPQVTTFYIDNNLTIPFNGEFTWRQGWSNYTGVYYAGNIGNTGTLNSYEICN